MANYIALLRKEEDSDFGVSFPDFPGCVTAGRTLDEARRFADEALRLHIDGMLEDGEDFPKASSLDEIMADRQNRDSCVLLVEIPDGRPKVVRVNVTFKEELLGQIDGFARDHRMSRSAFLEEAALLRISNEGLDFETWARDLLAKKAGKRRPRAKAS
jgi:predicted RNase H-like HicB family nuclease